MLTVTFNGHDITQYIRVTEDFERGVSTSRTNVIRKVGKADFNEYEGYTLDSKLIKMPFKMLDNLISKRKELAWILNVSDPAPLVFSDDPDIYYLAIPDGDLGLSERNFLGSGTINWLIVDGVAHSSTEKTITNNGNVNVSINYTGTYPAPLNFVVNHTSDNGFIGITNGEDIIQVGNPGEIDGVDYKANEVLLFDDFDPPTLPNWQQNTGYIMQQQHTSAIFDGAITFGNSRTVSTFGDNSHQGWHGPSIYREFNNDSAGDPTAINWELSTYSDAVALPRNSGYKEINISDDNGNIIAGLSWNKRADATARIFPQFWVGRRLVWEDPNNDRWNNFRGRGIIRKMGSQFWFGLYNVPADNGVVTFRAEMSFIDETFELTLAKGVTYWNAVWANQTAVDMSLRQLQFTKVNVEYWQDIPNTFSENSIVRIDCNDKKVKTFVNDVPSLDLQDVGSQPIMLHRGTNNISFLFSDFATIPDITMTYRERWL